MQSINSFSFVIIAGLIGLSQYFAFSRECTDRRILSRYRGLCIALVANVTLSVGMMLLFSSKYCFLLYGLDRFFKAVTIIQIVLITSSLVAVNDKIISIFISIVSYGALIIYLFDVLSSTGELKQSLYGVYYQPKDSWHIFLYLLYYMIYVVVLISFLVIKSATVNRKCDRHVVGLLVGVYFLSGSGFIAEQLLITYNLVYFPINIFFSTGAVVFLRKLLKYNQSITISPDTFSKELDPGRTDIAFILDDKLKVIDENKRASVFSKIVDDTFVGRKITDIFSFNDSSLGQILDDPDERPFGLNADYEKTGRKVNLVIKHKIDNYGEILATGVVVYNMEDIQKPQVVVNKEDNSDDNKLVENSLSVTRGAKALIVDEDVVFLNVFGRLLDSYEIEITRAVSGGDAIEQMKNNVFDIVFISQEMKKMNGSDTVRSIRSMAGDYYRQVPIVFITEQDINIVFNKFIEAGFNDYLTKPVTTRTLTSVLTRWLWQRFDNESTKEAEQETHVKWQYHELSELLASIEGISVNGKYEYLSYVNKGIRGAARILGLQDIIEVSSNLDDALLFEDTDRITVLFERLCNGIREELPIEL